jgi:hypothetical protein
VTVLVEVVAIVAPYAVLIALAIAVAAVDASAPRVPVVTVEPFNWNEYVAAVTAEDAVTAIVCTEGEITLENVATFVETPSTKLPILSEVSLTTCTVAPIGVATLYPKYPFKAFATAVAAAAVVVVLTTAV